MISLPIIRTHNGVANGARLKLGDTEIIEEWEGIHKIYDNARRCYVAVKRFRNISEEINRMVI